MLSSLEQKRLRLSKNTAAQRKSKLGQFFTPARTAAFLASLFPDDDTRYCRLLDAGAGIGSLSVAFLNRWRSGQFRFRHVEVDAFEIDRSLIAHLSRTLNKYAAKGNCVANIYEEDFIHAAVEVLSSDLSASACDGYTHAILNPPYKKINSSSAHRLALRRAGIETVNLYPAFVALAVALATKGGHIVAIIPRSFCNGPYYRPFRDFMFARTALRHIHLFAARNNAFKDDDVLQENVIIHLQRGSQQEAVTVSTSTDDTFDDLVTHEHQFERIVFPHDPERFIHVPTSVKKSTIELSPTIRYTLDELGIKVSTGPVVGYRLKAYLGSEPGKAGTVPLLYPSHFSNSRTVWPVKGKKPNAIECNSSTEKWLYPVGFYCVVRRCSAKEEKRRIVASVVEPSMFGDAHLLGFENHLNLFHANRSGLCAYLAHGLVVFLNTTAIDEHFRRFNGHTQVNATDLRLMHYPSRATLVKLGEWAMQQDTLTQCLLDNQLGAMLA